MGKTNSKTSKAGTEKTVEAPQNSTETVEAPKSTEKILKKSLSDAELRERLANARTRKGEIVRFLCTKTQDFAVGVIRTARLDKRSGFIQFRIEVLEYPEEGQALENPTGNWIVDGKIECPVRRTGVLWGKGDDSKDVQVVGEYEALPKKPAEKKNPPKPESSDDAAMAAALADMKADGLL